MEDFLSNADWATFAKLGGAAAKGLTGAPLPQLLLEKLTRRGYVEQAARGTASVVTAQGNTALANWQRSMRT